MFEYDKIGCDKMYDIYTTLENDTIESISDKYNITPYVLYQLNGLPINSKITPNTNIVVPKISNTYFDYYTIKKGDTLYKIADKYNVDYNLLALINGLDSNDYIYPNQEILIPKSSYSYYVTADGDTLSTVSKKFNIGQSELINSNETIYLLPGQLLVKKTGK